MKGCDSNSNLTAHAPCLYDAGFRFAGRYLKESASCLTHIEAASLSAAGLWVVAIVERGYPTTARYFSARAGAADAKFALDKAHVIGIPAGATLYFTVDMDARLAEVKGSITSYFRAIADVLHDHPYSLGVYGSGMACATLLKSTPVSHSWLAMSRGWSGSRTFTGWSIRQLAGETICGVGIDTDESNGFAGGFKIA